MSEPPVAPDDTPTRLLCEICRNEEVEPKHACVCADHFQKESQRVADLEDIEDELRAEVSRLQQELYETREQRELEHDNLVKALEENALLRRSLEMLTKQLDEKDEEITDLRFTIIRHNSPA